jgi:serine protease Do
VAAGIGTLGALLLSALPTPVERASTATAANPFCAGEYADDLGALAPRVRELDRQQYSYCVRNIATYECLSYGFDGNVRKTRAKAVLHGTAFAYRQQAGETFLLTNQHVAEWPSVTDEGHPIEGVSNGCKRVSETLRIVDNEADDYDRDDVALTRVVSDPQLDAAVLKAKVPLAVLPWRLGRSSALRDRNVVEVRGFPLGAFQATNEGKVISAYDHDDYKEWDHDDFVIDALLSSGNSGSPVLAVSCKTGEFELVGLYHAGYTRGSALNVVVGIDQVRDLMATLKRTPRSHVDGGVTLDATARGRLLRTASNAFESFFPFGGLTASGVPRGDDTLIFSIFSKEFPLRTSPIAVFEDLEAKGSFGELGRVWFGGAAGLKEYSRSALDADTQAQLARILDALRKSAVASAAYRGAVRDPSVSREHYELASRLERTLNRTADARRELAQSALDLAERLGPHGADPSTTFAVILGPAVTSTLTPFLRHPQRSLSPRDQRSLAP